MSIVKTAISLVIFLLINFFVFIVLGERFSNQGSIDIMICRVIGLVAILIFTCIYIYKKALVSVLLPYGIFIIVELFFTCYPKSHAVGYSYAGLIWDAMYWKPISEGGYRDNLQSEDIDDKKDNIVFIGDSFTSGHGINNASDRYSNIVRNKLSNYNVFNYALSGIGTKYEFQILKDLKYKPKYLYWQYFFNDVDELLEKYDYGYSFDIYGDLNRIERLIVKSSFYFNYLYWCFSHNDMDSYLNGITSGLKDSKLLEEHFSLLNEVVDYCHQNNIELIFIVMPALIFNNEHIYNLHTQKVADYIISKGVKIIDVNTLTKSHPKEKLVVNNLDPHANVLVNKIVANEILKAHPAN